MKERRAAIWSCGCFEHQDAGTEAGLMPLLHLIPGCVCGGGGLGPVEPWRGTTFCLDLLELNLDTLFPLPPSLSTAGSWETWGEGR